jgi:hypothetical protein
MTEATVAEKTVTINENTIVLKQIEHTGGGRNCYYSWHGVYQIISSTRQITPADIDALMESGFFGSGQVVDAKLSGEFINYSGSCDSSG